MDEISIAAPTNIVEYREGRFNHWILNPTDYGINHHSLNEIIIDSPEQSLDYIQAVFSGKLGAPRDIVLLNSAAAIYCAGNELSFEQALEHAKLAIDSGKAKQCFTRLRQLTQTLNKESNHE